MKIDAVQIGGNQYRATIECGDIKVEVEGGDPLLASQAAQAAFQNSKMARRATPASKVDAISGLLIETE